MLLMLFLHGKAPLAHAWSARVHSSWSRDAKGKILSSDGGVCSSGGKGVFMNFFLKSFCSVLVMTLAFGAQAEKKKPASNEKVAHPAHVEQRAPSSSGPAELVPSLGFTMAAPNLGVQYNIAKSSTVSQGAYFFFQTSKEKSGVAIVNQMISFGGQYKLGVFSAGDFSAHLAPGFGIHMIKDVPSGTTGSKSDVTALGPTLRIGALTRLNEKMNVGLERFEAWNWFSEDVTASVDFYSIIFQMDY